MINHRAMRHRAFPWQCPTAGIFWTRTRSHKIPLVSLVVNAVRSAEMQLYILRHCYKLFVRASFEVTYSAVLQDGRLDRPLLLWPTDLWFFFFFQNGNVFWEPKRRASCTIEFVNKPPHHPRGLSFFYIPLFPMTSPEVSLCLEMFYLT